MGKFSKDQIEIMRKAYGTLSRMDPSSPTYKKFIKFLGKLPKDQLKQLAAANIKFISMLAKHRIKGESVNEAKFDSTGIDWSDDMMWKWVSKALKSAGIKELKYTPMKSGWLGGKFVWGGFYKVQANKRTDVLPITVDKKGNIHLNVSPKKFIIGKVGKLPQVVTNLKDFKKSDLDVYESIGVKI